MFIPKRYGQSSSNTCPFCEKQALRNNKQGIPVCEKHLDKNLNEMKCDCGSYLDLKQGKYGAYFECWKCGNKNFNKVLENNRYLENRKQEIASAQINESEVFKNQNPTKIITENESKKERIIDTNDVEWF